MALSTEARCRECNRGEAVDRLTQHDCDRDTVATVLRAQSDSVVLFDEIDNFLLDRDTRRYAKQETVLQFMTPGMLTKLNDLRRAERIILVIATNYENRIDPAIKRPGRIDRSTRSRARPERRSRPRVMPANRNRRSSRPRCRSRTAAIGSDPAACRLTAPPPWARVRAAWRIAAAVARPEPRLSFGESPL